jgi:hypothetical protein
LKLAAAAVDLVEEDTSAGDDDPFPTAVDRNRDGGRRPAREAGWAITL